MELAEAKQGGDIVLLDIRPVTLVADYFVVCSGSSERQIGALTRDIVDTLKLEAGVRPIGVEGTADSGWVLVDFGDVILHVFSPTVRDYYQLEQLWSQATPVLRIQ
ncbi:MAG: ribosome silencing factor [Chloroflexi bacterium]|nr:ribosome silencing factor [Chloroflexota bacterium]